MAVWSTRAHARCIYPNNKIDELLPWAYIRVPKLKAVA
jgi:hypothetical protein